MTMNGTLFTLMLDALRADLFDRADALGPHKQAMYDQAVFTGFLNALDPNSPHCSGSETEAKDWHARAVAYLNSWTPNVPHERLV